MNTKGEAQRRVRGRHLLGPGLVVFVLSLSLALLQLRKPEAAGQRLEEALASQDSAKAVEANIGRLKRESRALMPEDERQATRFLAWSATASGFRVEHLELRAGEALAEIQPVEARLDLIGGVYDLPLILESLSMQAALLQLDALVVEVEKGGACTVALAGRYHRPVLPSAELSSQRAATLAPRGSPPALELLSQAAILSAWRGFASSVKPRRELSSQRFAELGRTLPAALVSASREGGRITWAPGAGVVLKPGNP